MVRDCSGQFPFHKRFYSDRRCYSFFFVLDVKLESFRSDNDFLEGIDTLGTDTINHHVIPQLLPSSDGAGTLQFASSDLYLRCEIHEQPYKEFGRKIHSHFGRLSFWSPIVGTPDVCSSLGIGPRTTAIFHSAHVSV